MELNTEFVRGNPFEVEFVRKANTLEYTFVTPQPFEIEFKRGSSIDVVFARPHNTLEYEFSIGKQGPKGEEGARGSLWFTGTTNPSNTFGEETDMYLNYITYDLFQKQAGQWVLVGNIRGPQGPAGDGQGVLPAGGTTGQQLAKASNTDFDAVWVDVTNTTYVFTQGTAEAVWNINHGLAKYPSVFVVSSGGNVVVGDIQYIDSNNITVTFSGGFSGKAYLN